MATRPARPALTRTGAVVLFFGVSRWFRERGSGHRGRYRPAASRSLGLEAKTRSQLGGWRWGDRLDVNLWTVDLRGLSLQECLPPPTSQHALSRYQRCEPLVVEIALSPLTEMHPPIH